MTDHCISSASARIGRMADEMDEALKQGNWIRVLKLHEEACAVIGEAKAMLEHGEQLLFRIGMAIRSHAVREARENA